MFKNPRWKKVLRDLWGNKTRTLLVILSIAVGVFAVGVIDSSREILLSSLSTSFKAINPSSASLATDDFDFELLEATRRSKLLSEADARRNLALRFRIGNGPWKNIAISAIQDFENIKVDKIAPESGAWPPKEKELLLERSSLGLVNVNQGDIITIEAPNGEQVEVRMAGLVHDLQRIPAKFSGQAYGYINFDTLERLGLPRKFNQLDIVVAEDKLDRTHISRVAAKIREDKVEASGIRVMRTSVPEPGKHVMDSPLKAMTLVLEVLGLLSLLLSGFLVINTISAILAQQLRQIGIMKAVGGQRGQIAGMYFTVVLIFGLLSLFISIPLGALGAHAFTNFVAGLLNFNIVNFAIPPRILLLEIAVGLLVPVLVSLYPIISGTRITVREAISNHGISSVRKEDRIDRILNNIRRVSRPLLLSLRNTFRRKGRLALTLTTLTLAAAVFISVFSVRASLLGTLETIMQYWQYDMSVSFSQPYRMKQIERAASHIPEVERVENWGYRNLTRIRPDGTENENIFALAPPPETDLIQPSLKEGRWLVPTDKEAIVINTDLVDKEPDLALGSEVIFRIDGRKTKWKVVGIVKGQLAGPMIYANYKPFSIITRETARTSFVVVKTKVHEPDAQAQIAKALEERFKKLTMRVNQTETNHDIRSRIAFQFDIIVVFMLIMAVLLAIVGGLGLMGTMSINVLERTREIGVMRAIGAANGSVFKIFMVEGIIIGSISWLLGSILAIPLSKFLSDAVGMAFLKTPLDYNFSTEGVLIWLGVVLVIAGAASFLPAWKAVRLSVRDTLSYE